MKKSSFYFGLFLITALFLGGGQSAAWALHDHGDYNAHGAHDAHAAHKVYEVPENEPAPSLNLKVMEDPVAGWNLHLVTENFTFAPYHAGQDHIPGEGHAHLYINDKKITRILSPWHHIPELPQETNSVKVSLSTNNHDYYSVNSQVVEDTVEIKAPQAEKTKGCSCPKMRCGC